MKLRCFIAVEIPEDIKKKISVLKKEIRGKIVPDENMHITLKFLGNIDEKHIPALVDKLKKVHFSPFDVLFKGIGAFPKKKHARVLWVGTESPALHSLAGQIQKLFHPDEQFVGHVTLARLQYQDIAAFIDKHKDDVFGTMHCTNFVLKKSTLSPTGSQYTTLETFQAS